MSDTKEEQRAPMLNNMDIEDWNTLEVLNWYENRITSGELMVVKTARVICSAETGWNPKCSACQNTIEGCDIDIGEFCRCGAKIIQ